MGKLKLLGRHWVMALRYPRPLIGIFYLPRFVCHWFKYSRSTAGEKVGLLDSQPCLGDWTAHTPFDAHYFHQGARQARRLAQSKPGRHVDIGSSVMTIGVLSPQVDITFVDYRPLKASLPGLTPVAGDILNLAYSDNSVPSLSCLHVIEHIGLGRYGDPLDPQGSQKAAGELQRIVSHGGRLFLSLRVGLERICFNAPASVLAMFPHMRPVEFSYVDDAGEYHVAASPSAAAQLQYGCGMFLFEKP